MLIIRPLHPGAFMLLPFSWHIKLFMIHINCFAKTNFRWEDKIFRIKKEDRRLHLYILGKTGMEKSSRILNMALDESYSGSDICLIDPHRDMIENLLDCSPSWRINDVIYTKLKIITYCPAHVSLSPFLIYSSPLKPLLKTIFFWMFFSIRSHVERFSISFLKTSPFFFND